SSRNTGDRSDKLDALKIRIYLGVAQMSEAMRGLLVNPKNEEIEDARRHFAETNLTATLDELDKAKEFKNHLDLIAAERKLREFTTGAVNGFHSQVVKLATNDLTAAIAYYNQNSPAIQKRREELFTELSQQIEKVKNADSIRVDKINRVGTICICLMLA